MLNVNAQKWVTALRSGKYVQTQGCLQDQFGYCCLGVACRLYADTYPMSVIRDSIGITAFDEYRTRLPVQVRVWLGLKQSAGDYDIGPDSYSLSDDNDDGRSFDWIADMIESEPEGLFEVV